MSTTLAIDANNTIANMIEQVLPRSRVQPVTEVLPNPSRTSRISEIPAVSTELSRDYNGSSIIDRGNIFSMATGGLASMERTSGAPQIDTYNSGAFLITHSPRINNVDIFKVY